MPLTLDDRRIDPLGKSAVASLAPEAAAGAVSGRYRESTSSSRGAAELPAQSLQVRLSSALPRPGTGSRAGEQEAQTASRHLRQRWGRRSFVNSASHTLHHRSHDDPAAPDADDVPSIDSDDEDDVRRDRPAAEVVGDGAFALGRARELRLRAGDPTSEAACSTEKRSSFICRCRREGTGVDTIESPDKTEELQEVSDSSSESRDGERCLESGSPVAVGLELEVPRLASTRLRRLCLLDLDCCCSHLRRSLPSGMRTRAWIKPSEGFGGV